MDTNEEKLSEGEEIKKLLELNLKRNEEILTMTRDIKKYMKWQNIWSILRFVLIAIPIVLGFIYLPPLLKGVFKTYSDLLNNKF